MNKLVVLLFLIISISLSAQTVVEWQTSMGNFKAELREDLVPITANNFIDLTDSGFYNDLIFHRVIDGFMIQDGCPLGNGYGGPGYTIPDEFHPDLLHDGPGVLSMANAGPDTGGSQYFITLAQTSWLDNAHAVFGNIIEGMDIVEAIGGVETNGNDKPLVDVEIYSITRLSPRITGSYPVETELTVELGVASPFVVVHNDEDVTYSWLIDDVEISTSTISFDATFTELGMHEVKCILTRNGYDYETSWSVEVIPSSSGDSSEVALVTSLNGNTPNPFNPTTKISFSLKQESNIKLAIYNLKGQLVKDLYNGILEAGSHSKQWDGTDANGKKASSGVYLYSLFTDEFSDTKKMIMLK